MIITYDFALLRPCPEEAKRIAGLARTIPLAKAQSFCSSPSSPLVVIPSPARDLLNFS